MRRSHAGLGGDDVGARDSQLGPLAQRPRPQRLGGRQLTQQPWLGGVADVGAGWPVEQRDQLRHRGRLRARAASRSDSTFSASLSARSTSDSSPRPAANRDVAAAASEASVWPISSSTPMVRSARKRSKYAFGHLRLDGPAAGSSPWRAKRFAIASAATRRAARLPPSGMAWVTLTMSGTFERSTGMFQSWTISIGSSNAAAGATAAAAARARSRCRARISVVPGASPRAGRRDGRRAARGGGGASAAESVRKAEQREHQRNLHDETFTNGSRVGRTPRGTGSA